MFWPHPVTEKTNTWQAKALYHQADQALGQGELDKALSLAHMARDHYAAALDNDGLSAAETLIGDIMVALDNDDLACLHYRRALATQHQARYLTVCIKLAEALTRVQRLAEAIAAYADARAVCKQLGQVRLGLRVTYQMAYLYYELGRWTDAERYYRKALRLDAKDEEHALRGTILLELGNTLAQRGRLVEAQRLFAQSAALAGASGDRAVLASALHGLGVTLASAGQDHVAQELSQQSLKLRTRLGDTRPAAAPAL